MQPKPPGSGKGGDFSSLLQDFRTDWSSSRWVEFLDLLPPLGDPARPQALLKITEVDLQYRYQDGDTLRLEDYLLQTPELGMAEDAIPILLELEFRMRRRYRKPLSQTDFLERFPQHRELINRLFSEPTPERNAAATIQTTMAASGATRKFLDPSNLPEVFGDYRIIRQLGAGGMGWVYLARDTRMDRLVALKVPKLSGAEDKRSLNRFYQEVRAAAALQHPNICGIYDVNQIDGVPFMTMHYINGKTLSSLIKPGKRWPEKEAIRVIRRLATVVHAAHQKGVIHRDLKPSNAMLSDQKELIVMDFGLAFRSDAEYDRLTRTGAPLGTPGYMSPEQAQGELDRIGPASDIYSLGVMLYELLTGKRPFIGHAAVVMAHHISTPPTPLREIRPSLSVQVEKVCLKALAKNPADRYLTALAFADALSACQKALGDAAEIASSESLPKVSNADWVTGQLSPNPNATRSEMSPPSASGSSSGSLVDSEVPSFNTAKHTPIPAPPHEIRPVPRTTPPRYYEEKPVRFPWALVLILSTLLIGLAVTLAIVLRQ